MTESDDKTVPALGAWDGSIASLPTMGEATLEYVQDPKRKQEMRVSWQSHVSRARTKLRSRKFFRRDEAAWALGVPNIIIDELLAIGKLTEVRLRSGKRVTRQSIEVFLFSSGELTEGKKKFLDAFQRLEESRIALTRFKRLMERMIAMKQGEIEQLRSEVSKRGGSYPVIHRQLSAFDKLKEVCDPKELIALCDLEAELVRIDPSEDTNVVRAIDSMLDTQVMSSCTSKCPLVDDCPVASPDMGVECGVMRRVYERVLGDMDVERGAPQGIMERCLRQQVARQVASVFYLDLSLFEVPATFEQQKQGTMAPVTDIMPAVEKRMRIANTINKTFRDLGIDLSKPLTETFGTARDAHIHALMNVGDQQQQAIDDHSGDDEE